MANSVIEAKYNLKDEKGKVKLDAEGKPVTKGCTAEFDFGADLDALVKKSSKDIVFSNACANITVLIQSRMRAMLKAGNTPEQIKAYVKDYKPGVAVRAAAADPIAAAKALFDSWSPDKQKAYIKELQAKV